MDERGIKAIVYDHVQCANPNDKLKLTIYYRTNTTSNLIMKNNQSPETPQLQRTNLIYEYKCNQDECQRLNRSYIGLTTTTLSRRLTMHLQHGSPKLHTSQQHHVNLTREMLVDNTKVLRYEIDYERLHILESLFIKNSHPSLNNQDTGTVRTLKLHNLPLDSPTPPHVPPAP